MTFTKDITAKELYETLKDIKVGAKVCQFSLKKCEELVPTINKINALKREKNAVILVHSYVTPEIIYGVGDYSGDSYFLSKKAMETNADIIVFAAVKFMGETAKILNPNKKVLIPGTETGCTLADSIKAQDVIELKKQYPDHTFICYINTTADVKAECHVCVTSANVYDVIQNYPNNKIYFLPDKLMGQNVITEMEKRGIKKEILYYNGTCTVHEEYQPDQVFKIKTEYPGVKVLCHPECKPEVCAQSDFVGSTSQMLNYMKTAQGEKFLMLTECGLLSVLQHDFPEKQLVGTCTLCPYMKSNTLENILRVLSNPTEKDEIFVDNKTIGKAAACIKAMFEYSKK